MKTICAYCTKTMIDGTDDRISHGICKECEKLVVAAEMLKECRTAADLLQKIGTIDARIAAESLRVWINYGLEIGLDAVPRHGGK